MTLSCGDCRWTDTILSLGAGLDTRPYRLELPPQLKWVEADYEDVVAYKNKLLHREPARCRLVPWDSISRIPSRDSDFCPGLIAKANV
jgi:O-methyltransferase involved in polyketide biosynthesis